MNVLITGSPGVGKTTIGKLLEEAGNVYIDIDHAPNLAYWMDKKTGERVMSPDDATPEWYEDHDWHWDREVLEQLLAKNVGKNVYVCGITANLAENLDLFDKVILLNSDLETLRSRRIGRRVGKKMEGGEFKEFATTDIEQGFDWHHGFQQGMIDHGAISIEASQSIEEIVKKILGLTQRL